MKPEKDAQKMVSMKVPLDVHTAFMLLKKRYNTSGKHLKLGESIWQFIEDTDPELAKTARRATELREELANILGDDDDE
jgi:hypothetical protein